MKKTIKLDTHCSVWLCEDVLKRRAVACVSDCVELHLSTDQHGHLKPGTYVLESYLDIEDSYYWLLVEGTAWGAFVETWEAVAANNTYITWLEEQPEAPAEACLADYIRTRLGRPSLVDLGHGSFSLIDYCARRHALVDCIYRDGQGGSPVLLRDEPVAYLLHQEVITKEHVLYVRELAG